MSADARRPGAGLAARRRPRHSLAGAPRSRGRRRESCVHPLFVPGTLAVRRPARPRLLPRSPERNATNASPTRSNWWRSATRRMAGGCCKTAIREKRFSNWKTLASPAVGALCASCAFCVGGKKVTTSENLLNKPPVSCYTEYRCGRFPVRSWQRWYWWRCSGETASPAHSF